MKRNIMITLNWLVLVFVATPIHAQNPADELKKIGEWYTSCKTFRSDFQYLLYTDASMKKMIEKQKGSYYRSGNKKYMNALGTECVVNDQYTVVVNHEQKIILASRVNQDVKTDPVQLDFLGDIEESKGVFSHRIISKDMHEITISYTQGDWSFLKVCYDPVEHKVQEVKIQFAHTNGVNWEYKTNPYLVIKYNNVKSNIKIDASLFDESRFIRIYQGKVKAAAAWLSYKIFSTIQ